MKIIKTNDLKEYSVSKMSAILYGYDTSWIYNFAIGTPTNPDGQELKDNENNKLIEKFKKIMDQKNMVYKPIKGNADIIGIYNLSRGETVESFINKHKDKNIFVDFHATWCGPCKQLGPILCQKAAQIGALVLKVDVDQHQNIAAEKGISSIPVVMLYKNGIKTETMVGYNPSKLEDMINLARN